MLNAIKDVHDIIEKLEEHWFDSYGPRKGLSAKHRPAFAGGLQSKHGTPWKDIIAVNSVIVKFPSLKRSPKLQVSVRNHISHDSTVLHANTASQSTTESRNGA